MINQYQNNNNGFQYQIFDSTSKDHSLTDPPILASEGGRGWVQPGEVVPGTQSGGGPNNALGITSNNTGEAGGSGGNPDNGAGARNTPPRPPNPPNQPIVDSDDNDDDDDDDDEFTEEETVVAEMKRRGLAVTDLLRQDEYTYVDDSNSNNVGVKFPENARWMGKCMRCHLSFPVQTRLTIEDRGDYCCPSCNHNKVAWTPSKKEIITIDKLIPRIPEVFKNLYDQDWERD